MAQEKDQRRSILLTVLRSTFKRLEQSEEVTPNDPALRTIKSSILRTIARREMDTTTKSPPPDASGD